MVVAVRAMLLVCFGFLLAAATDWSPVRSQRAQKKDLNKADALAEVDEAAEVDEGAEAYSAAEAFEADNPGWHKVKCYNSSTIQAWAGLPHQTSQGLQYGTNITSGKCAKKCEETEGCIGIKHYDKSQFCHLMSSKLVECTRRQRLDQHWVYYLRSEAAKQLHVRFAQDVHLKRPVDVHPAIPKPKQPEQLLEGQEAHKAQGEGSEAQAAKLKKDVPQQAEVADSIDDAEKKIAALKAFKSLKTATSITTLKSAIKDGKKLLSDHPRLKSSIDDAEKRLAEFKAVKQLQRAINDSKKLLSDRPSLKGSIDDAEKRLAELKAPTHDPRD